MQNCFRSQFSMEEVECEDIEASRCVSFELVCLWVVCDSPRLHVLVILYLTRNGRKRDEIRWCPCYFCVYLCSQENIIGWWRQYLSCLHTVTIIRPRRLWSSPHSCYQDGLAGQDPTSGVRERGACVRACTCMHLYVCSCMCVCACVSNLCFICRSLIFQKRWVMLDAQYLRYFQNEKVQTSSIDPHIVSQIRVYTVKYLTY